MLLKEIVQKPLTSLKNMERYVNDGSPSGFSFTHTTSVQYSPSEGVDKFSLPVFWSDEVKTYGQIPSEFKLLFSNNGQNAIPFHPDNLNGSTFFKEIS